ncbi:DUF4232 domain-containing protein [Streptomyces tubbatahanensis]|uniref:DUF4232 domain-containing protein n=1 Tax=Streptomyces tubbatahanensis TaxID=2923272 RepID=A0ABY3Y1I8_9ACTN|nr:DUF4232 domain-containing protein [Streptomyces tubbatahanensis]UNT00613.1 DUF4232 domain-containing protein [Streptomyces tubbatahanensis]
MREQQKHTARATGRADEAGAAARRVARGPRLATVAAVGLAAALLTGCGGEGADASAPKKVNGEAAPAPGDSPGDKSAKKSASPSESSRSEDGKAGKGKESTDSPGSGGSGSSGEEEGSGPGEGSSGTGPCKTSGLAFSSSPGMGEGTMLVNMRNTGSAACTLHGFPGVDLQTREGSLSANRNNAPAPSVSIEPGEETRFTLHYPPNDTGGSGVTVNSLTVTPPNETASQSVPATINLPVTDGSGPGVTVGPVGAGK